MKRFRAHLERLDASLTLPQPQRSYVIEELAADLEDLYRQMIADGVPAGEAERRALSLLLPDEGAARELESVHRSTWARFLERFDSTVRSRIECFAVVLLTAATVVFVLAGLPLGELLLDPSPFLVPVLGVGCAGLVTASIMAGRLFIRGVRSADDGARGIGFLLLCTGAAPLLGMAGLLVDLYIAAGRISEDPSISTIVVTRLLRTDGTLLASALALSLLTALCWLLLRTRIATLRAVTGTLRQQQRLTLYEAEHERTVKNPSPGGNHARSHQIVPY